MLFLAHVSTETSNVWEGAEAKQHFKLQHQQHDLSSIYSRLIRSILGFTT